MVQWCASELEMMMELLGHVQTLFMQTRNRGSSLNIVAILWAGLSGLDSLQGHFLLSLLHWLWGPPCLLSNG
jgi:hypothetical protein